MRDVTDIVTSFSEYLSESWNSVSRFCKYVSDSEALIGAWLQSSWEVLVENTLPAGNYLPPYNGGAEFYDDSSRIYMPNVLPSHIVVCFGAANAASMRDVLTGADINVPSVGLPLDKLVAIADGWYVTRPPFDHVFVQHDGAVFAFRLADAKLIVRAILDEEI